MVEDINLTVGTGIKCGESIIQDVSGLSVIIRRSLRDLSHQIPVTEATIQIEILKAALSNKEYEIITECASSNISETPSIVPPLERAIRFSEKYVENPVSTISTVMVSEPVESERWITIKVSVFLDFVELSLHSGTMRDSPLASVQAREAWLLFKSNSFSEGFLFATIKDFLVIDAREGIKDEFRLAIGKSWSADSTLFDADGDDFSKSTHYVEKNNGDDFGDKPIPPMLILDATTRDSSTNISLCVQRPKLLVALDFLLAIAEFFVPSLHSMLSNDEESAPLPLAIILDQQIFVQPSSVFSLSPQKPLIVDDEKFEIFIYDGKGGKLYLKDRDGRNISDITSEIIIHVGNQKRLQFKNVTIVNGHCLDSCVFLGSNSSYSVSKEDSVFLEVEQEVLSLDTQEDRKEAVVTRSTAAGSTEFVIELQAIISRLELRRPPKRLLRSKRAAGSHSGDSTAGGHPSRADPPPGDLLVEVRSGSDPRSGGRSARAWAAWNRRRRPRRARLSRRPCVAGSPAWFRVGATVGHQSRPSRGASGGRRCRVR
ncbi:hypothetical protein KSP40_PGU008212 [Platanthera guangdongensis]|uniref:Uncharacterized protein n=1 Tax=Platanthera guangdongensis TaxID=2320717 RepID=A0ABR2LVC3_9ASPA